jgi:isochorismate hydrolase
MSSIKLVPENGLLLVIDVQERFLSPIFESDRVEARCKFLCQVATLFEVPILATEQYPERMGGIVPSLLPFVGAPFRKMQFSALLDSDFINLIKLSGRTQIIVIGIETHICVSQICSPLASKSSYAPTLSRHGLKIAIN